MSGEVEISTFGQRLSFQLVWFASSSWLRLSAGRTAYELPPSGPDVAVHQAAIIRVPSRVASSVVPVLERLRQHNAHHHYYPPETMHVTIGKLGQFASDDPGAATRLDKLRHIAALHPSFDLSMWGLNLSPSTVFAQRYFRTTRLFTRCAGTSEGLLSEALISQAAKGSLMAWPATWRSRTSSGSPIWLRQDSSRRSLASAGPTSGDGRYGRWNLCEVTNSYHKKGFTSSSRYRWQPCKDQGVSLAAVRRLSRGLTAGGPWGIGPGLCGLPRTLVRGSR